MSKCKLRQPPSVCCFLPSTNPYLVMTDRTVTNLYTELSNCFAHFTAVRVNHAIFGENDKFNFLDIWLFL